MAIVPFKHYLHDDDEYALVQDIARQIGAEISEELAEKIGRPFYEVTLDCTLDTETGAVEVVSTSL